MEWEQDYQIPDHFGSLPSTIITWIRMENFWNQRERNSTINENGASNVKGEKLLNGEITYFMCRLN